jgi:predicted kinase
VNRPVLLATIGPPGAGKSTWRRQVASRPRTTVVNLDQLRGAVSWCGCTMNQDVTPLAAELAISTARGALAAGHRVIWDATNAHRSARLQLQVLAAEHDARTAARLFLPPVEVTLAGNAARSATPCLCGYARRVPEPVIRSMDESIRRDLPSLPDEGWHSLTTCQRTRLMPPEVPS